MIVLVAAMSRGRVIGKDGALPWGHGTMKHDQRRFRQLIEGKIIAIGAGTYNPSDDYIQNAGHVFLLTNRDIPNTDKLTALGSLKPVLEAGKLKDVYVVGGARVFEEFLPHADKLELTYISAKYEGDRFFPEFSEGDWQIVNEEAHSADSDTIHPYKFVTLVRK